MIQNFRHGRNHVLHIAIAHSVKHRKAEETVESIFGDKIFTATMPESIAVIGMQMNRNVMDIDADVLGAQCFEDLVSSGGKLFQLQSNRIQMLGRLDVIAHGGNANAW